MSPNKPVFLENAFNKSFSSKSTTSYSSTDILKIAFRGGFPEIIALNEKEHKQWHRDYIDAIIARDLKDLANIRRFMHELIKILAAWSSKFMDIAAIGSHLSITRTTIESYINAIEMLYLVETVPAWVKTDYARVGKRDKLFMTDTGLMTSILSWNIEEVKLNPDRLGKIFETLVFNELSAHIDSSSEYYKLFHYRDRNKREIDFLIEREDETIVGIEVKSSSTVSPNHFKNLKWFVTNIAKQNKFIGIYLFPMIFEVFKKENCLNIKLKILRISVDI